MSVSVILFFFKACGKHLSFGWRRHSKLRSGCKKVKSLRDFGFDVSFNFTLTYGA